MCLFPIAASLPPEGGKPILNSEGDLRLPCGKCHECISKRALEWATRARHEISEHNENSFITLTYNPENLKSNKIIKKDFQKFIKRLRQKLPQKIKYMVSYEYGSKYFRPHMHAIIFGYNPKNQKFLKNTSSGHPLFTSTEIEKLWKFGYHSIGVANEQTAYYIASYALKSKKRTIIHEETGEEMEINDSMNSSKNPAIGLDYLLKNSQQLVDSGQVLPRYYQKKLEELNPDLFQQYQDRVQAQIKDRSTGETYANFIINSQQNSLSNTAFRETTKNHKEEREFQFKKRYLKNQRDDYVTYIKERKKC